MSYLELTNITKRFSNKTAGSVLALDKVSFQADNSDFVAIIGPSGSGKSTLLRIIAGLETPTEGEVYLDGALLNNIGSEQRNMTLVSQSFSLYPHMSVFENIAFPLRMRKIPLAEIVTRVNKAAQMLGIDFLLSRKPRVLSLGQCQRVAIARSIVRYPNVFLFDEPLSNLDAATRSVFRTELAKLHSELNTTFVYVTHDVREAMSLATKLAVLDKGKLLQIDSPETVFNSPASLQVAEYVADFPLNIVPAQIRMTNNGLYASGEVFDIALDSDLSDHDGNQVTMVIRANAFSLAATGENADFSGIVNRKEFVGKTSLLTVDTPMGALKVLSGDADANIGSTVFLLANTAKILFFGADGMAIRN